MSSAPLLLKTLFTSYDDEENKQTKRRQYHHCCKKRENKKNTLFFRDETTKHSFPSFFLLHLLGPFISLSSTTLRSTDCPCAIREATAARTSPREKPIAATSSMTRSSGTALVP